MKFRFFSLLLCSLLFALLSCGDMLNSGEATLTINLGGNARAATGFENKVDTNDLGWVITMTNYETGSVRNGHINSQGTAATVTGLSAGDWDIIIEAAIFGGWPYARGVVESFPVVNGHNKVTVPMERLHDAIAVKGVSHGGTISFPTAEKGGISPESKTIEIYNFTGTDILEVTANIPADNGFSPLPTAPLSIPQDGYQTITINPVTPAAGVFTPNLTLSADGCEVASIPLRFAVVVQPITSISISPDDTTVVRGGTRQFAATIAGGNSHDVAWTVEGNAAAGTTINATGLLSVAITETASELTITATSLEDPTKSATATAMLVVTNSSEWNQAISAIDAAGSGNALNIKQYTINITDSFSAYGSPSNTFSPSFINVTVNGNGKEINLSSVGNLLRVGANQTVIIDELSLRGLNLEDNDANNNAAVVYIENGSFIMNGNSSAVRNNTNTSTTGGAVYVTDGSFTMNGGTITGNSSILTNPTASGGLYVTGSVANPASVNLAGGSISGNTGLAGDVFLAPMINSFDQRMITHTMAGNASVGTLTMTANLAGSSSKLTIITGWTGSIERLNLYGEETMSFVINIWVRKDVLEGSGVNATTVSRIGLGNFMSQTAGDIQAISPTFKIDTAPATPGRLSFLYAVGDTGPGDGIIFYVADGLSGRTLGFTVQMVNPAENYTAYYLEAGSKDVSGSHMWSTGGQALEEYPGWDGIDGINPNIGAGRKNTDLILAKDSTAPAALQSKTYGTPGDWFLPSALELKAYLDSTATKPTTGTYWSSSQYDASQAIGYNFTSVAEVYQTNGTVSLVRPVRAF